MTVFGVPLGASDTDLDTPASLDLLLIHDSASIMCPCVNATSSRPFHLCACDECAENGLAAQIERPSSCSRDAQRGSRPSCTIPTAWMCQRTQAIHIIDQSQLRSTASAEGLDLKLPRSRPSQTHDFKHCYTLVPGHTPSQLSLGINTNPIIGSFHHMFGTSRHIFVATLIDKGLCSAWTLCLKSTSQEHPPPCTIPDPAARLPTRPDGASDTPAMKAHPFTTGLDIIMACTPRGLALSLFLHC